MDCEFSFPVKAGADGHTVQLVGVDVQTGKCYMGQGSLEYRGGGYDSTEDYHDQIPVSSFVYDAKMRYDEDKALLESFSHPDQQTEDAIRAYTKNEMEKLEKIMYASTQEELRAILRKEKD